MSDGAVDAVRRKKDSSVSRAVDLVKKGDADAIVSAGHTGAAVAATTIKLRTLPGIDRPGIAAVHSDGNKRVCADRRRREQRRARRASCCSTRSWARSIRAMFWDTRIPTIGLMSIGGEDVKGNDLTKEVFKMLKQSDRSTSAAISKATIFSRIRSKWWSAMALSATSF